MSIMAAEVQMFLLFGGVLGLLTFATVVGQVLESRSAGAPADAGIVNLNARINGWWAMVACAGLALLFGTTGVTVLFAILSLAALREFITLSHTRRSDHWALLAGFFFVVPVQYALVWSERYGIYSVFIPVYAFLIMPIISVLHGDVRRFLGRVAEVQWGLMICVFCLSHVPALLMLDIPGYEGRNILLVAFLFIVAQSSDVLQYVWGKLAGRRRIAPKVSPAKTVEGFLGGVLSATVIGAGLWWITPFAPWQAASLAMVIALMGFLGGLVMSAIKRDRGVKDWGWMIEGHGGSLDRLDSVVFAAPVFFHLVRFWWAS